MQELIEIIACDKTCTGKQKVQADSVSEMFQNFETKFVNSKESIPDDTDGNLLRKCWLS